ncbi:MAG: hypothetical protein WD512_11080 [Candidatus Paceibacterota bacterium]
MKKILLLLMLGLVGCKKECYQKVVEVYNDGQMEVYPYVDVRKINDTVWVIYDHSTNFAQFLKGDKLQL